MRHTRFPASARAAPRWTVVVVFPTPPFWFISAMIRIGWTSVSRGRASVYRKSLGFLGISQGSHVSVRGPLFFVRCIAATDNGRLTTDQNKRTLPPWRGRVLF